MNKPVATTPRRGPRVAVVSLALSAFAFVGILTHEGYTDRAVIPVPGDVPTVGFGTTGGVKMGDKTTPVVAANRALSDVSRFEGAIKQCIRVPLHQHEYDAMISFSYNVGPTAFCRSTLVKRLNEGDYTGACHEMGKWVFVGRNKVAGLVSRRNGEIKQCLGQS